MNVEAILANYDFSQVQVLKSIAPLLLAGLIVGAISLAVGIYTFLQMRKMQKKNRPKPNQIDGTIADEGISFYDLAGSPHVHANITDIWDKSTKAIKKKSGGFLGIGSSSQVTGYRYYAKFAAFIGNRIEKLIAINFDNRKWIVHDPLKHPPNLLPVLEGNLFGENEGGVSGNIDIHFGYPDQEPNAEYQKYFPLVSGYPYQSYLVFRGLTSTNPLTGKQTTAPGFYLGNSGYMKEMLLWVKRTRVRNDGSGQWYATTSDRPWVCEIGDFSVGDRNCYQVEAFIGNPRRTFVSPTPEYNWTQTGAFVFGANFGVNKTESILMVFEVDYSTAESVIFDFYQIQSTSVNFSITCNMPCTIRNLESGSPGYFSKSVKVQLEAGQNKKLILSVNVNFEAEIGKQNRLFVGSNYEPMVSGFFCNSRSAIDINPIHKIREILTDDTAMAKPEIDVNDVNFRKAADRIWDEGLGVSWAVDEKSCLDAIEELCYHIEAGIRVNRQTGLYEMVLFRDDWFAENEIHAIAENKIKDLSLEVMNSDDIVNQLNVTYYDRERIKNSTFSVYENGSILTMGKANAESIDFPYFMNMRNAEVVANWKLKQYSTPAWKGTLTTGWREARKWNRYDLVKITWSKKWQGTILARIMKIDLGNGLNNEVMIDFEEVVPYSGEMNTSIVVDDSMETKPMPPQSAIFKTFEIPYYDLAQLKTQAELDLELSRNPNIGFVAAVAGRPQQNSIDAQLHTESDIGYELVSNVEYASFARTDEAVNRTQQSFVIKNEDLSTQFRQDSLIMLGDEIVIYKSYDAETKTLTVERGALDTIPQNHIENTVLYFYDDAFAYDPEGYTSPKTVNATVLTTTPSGIESLETSPKRQVQIESRAIRPYPPANVKINDGYWTAEIETDLIITWVDRNRAQQTGGEILGWYEGGVTLENRATYQLILTERDENEVELRMQNLSLGSLNTYTFATAAMNTNTRTIEITLKSLRDGYESYQSFNHTVELSQFFSAPYDLIVEFKND